MTIINKCQETQYNFDPAAFFVNCFWGRRPDGVAINEALQIDNDDCFYYHFWRNNVVITFGDLSSFLSLLHILTDRSYIF